jgi:hypothetical protein
MAAWEGALVLYNRSWGALALGWSGYIIYKAIFPIDIKHSLPPKTSTHFDQVTARVLPSKWE